MWRVKDQKKSWNQNPDTCFDTRNLHREGVISVSLPPHGFAEPSRWRPTNQSFTFAVQSQNQRKKEVIAKQLLDWNSFDIFFHHLLFLLFYFLMATKMKNPKIQAFGTRPEPILVWFPPFIYGTETEPHKWARGAVPYHMFFTAGEEKWTHAKP